jgi:hypothetical protein
MKTLLACGAKFSGDAIILVSSFGQIVFDQESMTNRAPRFFVDDMHRRL